MKQLPKSFCIDRDEITPKTYPRWERFIDWISAKTGNNLAGRGYRFYGIEGPDNCYAEDMPLDIILTLEQWEEYMFEKAFPQSVPAETEWQPTPGEMVEVGDKGDDFREAKFLGIVDNLRKYIASPLDNGDIPIAYKFCRPLPQSTFTIQEAIKALSLQHGISEDKIKIA